MTRKSDYRLTRMRRRYVEVSFVAGFLDGEQLSAVGERMSHDVSVRSCASPSTSACGLALTPHRQIAEASVASEHGGEAGFRGHGEMTIRSAGG